MLRFSLDLSELNNFAKEMSALDLKAPTWAVVRKHSLLAMRQIKGEMPKDTGRAAASWGKFDARYLRGRSRLRSPKSVRRYRARGVKREQVASSEDAIWREDKNNLTIEQGTFVPYVERLNDGSSQQAPAGFIDNAMLVMENRIDENEILNAVAWGTNTPVTILQDKIVVTEK